MTCPACGAAAVRAVYRDRWPTGFEKRIHRCGACGLAFVAPMPTAAALAALYDDRRYFARETPGEIGYAHYDPPLRWFCDLLDQLERLGARGSLLDVGPATGAFLRLAQQRGFQVSGIEPSEWAAQQARAAGLNVRAGLFEDLAPAEAPACFDVVAMSHVIEHFRAPDAVLAECARLLRPGGVLVIWTINYAAPMWRDPKRTYGSEGREHLFYFTPESLRRMVARAGLVVRRCFTQPCPTPRGWAAAERFQGRVPAAGKLAGRWFTWIYQGILRSAFRPLRWSDLILLASKR